MVSMMRTYGVALGLAAGLATVSTATLAQSSPSPYDMKFQLRNPPAGGAPLHADMTTGSAVKTRLAPTTSGIILRWCRPELAFGTWQFGNLATQRKLLDGAWCEVQAGGTIGNIEGKFLDPIR